MKKLLSAVILISFLSGLSAVAQPIEEWVVRHDGANGYDLAEVITLDSDGNIYVSGRSTYPGEMYDIVTIKYDPDGNEVWLIRYTGSTHEYDGAVDICVDADYYVYITGYCNAGMFSADWITIKYNPDGTEAWNQVYSGGGGSAIAVDGDGNVIVVGSSGGDIATIKYSPSGAQLWVSLFDGPISGNDSGADVTVDGNGNIYVTGSVDAGQYNPNWVIIKYNPDGTEAWVVFHDAAGYPDTPNALLLDESETSLYIIGSSALTTDTNSDLLVIKYSSAGAYIWESRYDYGGSSDFGNHIARGPDGNVFGAGSSMINDEPPGHYDYTTIKFDPDDGTQLWVRQYDGPANKWDFAYGLAVDGGGNAYVGGRSQGEGDDYDYGTVAYDPDGNELWAMRYDGPIGGEDYGDGGVAVDADLNVYVTGNSQGDGTSADYATVKYSQGGASGCQYVVGDVNSIGAVGPYNGLDITYGVAYFKGGDPPMYECECTTGNTWYVSGDVNGSCSYNGLDITYGVAYFKGGSDPYSCPDCPPS